MESAKREEEDCGDIGTIIWNRMYKAARKRCRDKMDFEPFRLSYEYVIKPSEF